MDKLYFYLFNSITDAIELLQEDNVEEALALLVSTQMQAEDRYLDLTESRSEL